MNAKTFIPSLLRLAFSASSGNRRLSFFTEKAERGRGDPDRTASKKKRKAEKAARKRNRK